MSGLFPCVRGCNIDLPGILAPLRLFSVMARRLAQDARPGRRLLLAGLAAVILSSACARPTGAPVYTREATDRGAMDRARPAATGEQPAGAAANVTHHAVAEGDTLYSIAWRHSLDYRSLARWNGIREPYLIYAGQHLRLQAPRPEQKPEKKPEQKPKPRREARPAETAAAPSGTRKQADWTLPSDTAEIAWRWPTEGRLATRDTPTARKGIDIIGQRGQTITAAADGEVVYSSNGLRMYGNMVIIKHNATWLSAYAYNSALLVSEGERVRAGQAISEMGQAPGKGPILHFEIRKNGQPTDPLTLLPKKRS